MERQRGDTASAENASPMYVRDQRIKALQVEPNAPLLATSHLVEDAVENESVDVERVTSAKRCESERRLRAKQQHLKRFRDQICLRISEWQQQSRLVAQQQEQLLDAKFAKVLEATRPTEKPRVARPVRARSFEVLALQTSTQLQGCALASHVEKVLRIDAQTRDLMLASVRPPSECYSRDAKADAAATTATRTTAAPRVWDSESEDSTSVPRNSAHALLPKQRVALYATVRRRYMERERAEIKRLAAQRSSEHAEVARAESKRQSDVGVKVIDATAGCEVRLHKQVATSSTPWRKKSSPPKTTTATTLSGGGDVARGRFLSALESELQTPPLCSCARNMASSPFYERPCANNCALYNAPKKREQLLTSVYKQQQLAGSGTRALVVAANSPAAG